MRIGFMQCCGVKEIGNLRDYPTAEEAMQSFILETPTKPQRGAFVIFTEVLKPKPPRPYGMEFMNLIRKEKLGTVLPTTIQKNPNSKHLIKLFVWTLDHQALVNYKRRKRIRSENWRYTPIIW